MIRAAFLSVFMVLFYVLSAHAVDWRCVQRCAHRESDKNYYYVPTGLQSEHAARHFVIKIPRSLVKAHNVEESVLRELGDDGSSNGRQRALHKWADMKKISGILVSNGEEAKRENEVRVFGVLEISKNAVDWYDYAVADNLGDAFKNEMNMFKHANAPFIGSEHPNFVGGIPTGDKAVKNGINVMGVWRIKRLDGKISVVELPKDCDCK